MKKPPAFYYFSMKSEFGEITIVWRHDKKKLMRVFLPSQHRLFRSSDYKNAAALKKSATYVHRVCSILDKLLRGKPAIFPLDLLDWSVVYSLQRRVLRMEHRIPHGMVSTYGRLAHKLGHARAARAVGTALARNPFPVIVPCHRTIRADRTMGGYAGGLSMKQRLLELEGLQFDRYGRVMAERFW
jgi:methylated-DNA-[protein]-cysteine S-methyltransferase